MAGRRLLSPHVPCENFFLWWHISAQHHFRPDGHTISTYNIAGSLIRAATRYQVHTQIDTFSCTLAQRSFPRILPYTSMNHALDRIQLAREYPPMTINTHNVFIEHSIQQSCQSCQIDTDPAILARHIETV